MASWQFATDTDGNVIDKLKAAAGINLSEYSTVLDKSKLTREQIEDAERLAREIESVCTACPYPLFITPSPNTTPAFRAV